MSTVSCRRMAERHCFRHIQWMPLFPFLCHVVHSDTCKCYCVMNYVNVYWTNFSALSPCLPWCKHLESVRSGNESMGEEVSTQLVIIYQLHPSLMERVRDHIIRLPLCGHYHTTPSLHSLMVRASARSWPPASTLLSWNHFYFIGVMSRRKVQYAKRNCIDPEEEGTRIHEPLPIPTVSPRE